MNAYFGTLIDKSLSKQNTQLVEKIEKELKKKIKKLTIFKKESNTFLFIGIEKNLKKPNKTENYGK